MTKIVKGCKELFNEVIDDKLCAYCGACSGGCPYIIPHKGRMILMDNCTLSDGQCYHYCPRTYTDMDAISREVFDMPYSEQEMGNFIEIFIARSTDPHIREQSQYGGTVTALITLAMKEGVIENAILTRTNNDKIPEPVLVQNEDDVLQCTSSSYMACPVIERLNKIPKEDSFNVGIVTTPCQGLALSKMKQQPPQNRFSIDNVKLIIGLFCTWALSPSEFGEFLAKSLNLPLVKKFNIPPPPANTFDAYTSSGKISISLEQVRKYMMPTCAYCLDMTSEFADISVGAVEGTEGWNTVITRTEAGAELIEIAKSKRKLEIMSLPPQNLAHLKEAALLKKKRALAEIVKRTGDQKNLLYIGLSEDIANKLLGQD